MHEKLAQAGREQKPSLAEEMAREHTNRAIDKQQEAERDLQRNEPSKASGIQQEALGELQKALQQLVEAEESTDKQESTGGQKAGSMTEAGQQEQQTEAETGDSAEKNSPVVELQGQETPHDIINEELGQRKYRAATEATGYKAVERDW